MIDILLLVSDVGDAFPLQSLWSTAIGFISLMVALAGVIGVSSTNLSVGAIGAYLMFAFYAVESPVAFLQPVLIVSLVLIFVGTVFKIWKLEGLSG